MPLDHGTTPVKRFLTVLLTSDAVLISPWYAILITDFKQTCLLIVVSLL